MGVAGLTFAPPPGNTQGPCSGQYQSLGRSQEKKESEELEQEPSTFLRAEAHCLLLQGDGGLGLV